MTDFPSLNIVVNLYKYLGNKNYKNHLDNVLLFHLIPTSNVSILIWLLL